MKNILVLLIVVFLIVCILFRPKKDKYQIIDLVKYVCRNECLKRGYTLPQCMNENNYFMNNCNTYMIDLIGPLPKGVHLKDIYAEIHTPQ